MISTAAGIHGGQPHLDNARLRVTDILGFLFQYKTVDWIVQNYAPDVSEEQVLAAIAWAQDFIEEACDPRRKKN